MLFRGSLTQFYYGFVRKLAVVQPIVAKAIHISREAPHRLPVDLATVDAFTTMIDLLEHALKVFTLFLARYTKFHL